MNKLQNKLKITGGVTCRRFAVIRPLIEIMDSITVVKGRWHDRFKQEHMDMYPLDLSKLETWSTFSGCVSLTFSMINGKFIECEAVIYDGDFHGDRTYARFTATLKIPYTFLTEIKDSIKYSFESYCEKKYDEHLLEQKKAWVRRVDPCYLL